MNTNIKQILPGLMFHNFESTSGELKQPQRSLRLSFVIFLLSFFCWHSSLFGQTTVNLTTVDQTVCVGSMFTFNVTFTPTTPPYSFTYTYNGVPTTTPASVATSQDITIPATVAGNVVITAATDGTATPGVLGADVTMAISLYSLPTITTTGTVAASCYNDLDHTTTLAYTATTNIPTSYSIDWDAAANGAGLLDQGSTLFAFAGAGGTINNIEITGGTTAGTYTGTMTIKNANNCTNTHAVSVTINPLPGDIIITSADYCTGALGGSITVPLSEVGVRYRIYTVP